MRGCCMEVNKLVGKSSVNRAVGVYADVESMLVTAREMLVMVVCVALRVRHFSKTPKNGLD